MADTKIEWSDAVWNPTGGCELVSAGCDNCYAMRMSGRLQEQGYPKYAGVVHKPAGRTVWTGRVNIDEAALEIPAKWKKPRLVFVNSMSDLFHKDVPYGFIEKVWQVMERHPRHTYQILTKRPRRMMELMQHLPVLSHVWLGVSVEDQRTANVRMSYLRETRALVRFISAEPLLEQISLNLYGIHWVIVGGESGPGHRPMDPDWARSVRDQCIEAKVPFFFKQVGGRRAKDGGRLLDGRTWDQYPGDAC